MTGVQREAKTGSPIACGKGWPDPQVMATPDSALDLDEMARARALLEKPKTPERMWPVLGAAGLLAISALTFATAMVMAPPIVSEHVADQRGVP
jgi:hypothetical protein